MMLKPVGEKVRLCDLEPGTLFAFGDDCIAVKSEYLLNSGKIEAIIVGSGEFFHGGAKTVQEHDNLMVQPLELDNDTKKERPKQLCIFWNPPGHGYERCEQDKWYPCSCGGDTDKCERMGRQ